MNLLDPRPSDRVLAQNILIQRALTWDRLMEIHQIAEWIDDDGLAIEICMECCVAACDEDGEPCGRSSICESGDQSWHEHTPGRPVCRTRAVLLGVER